MVYLARCTMGIQGTMVAMGTGERDCGGNLLPAGRYRMVGSADAPRRPNLARVVTSPPARPLLNLQIEVAANRELHVCALDGALVATDARHLTTVREIVCDKLRALCFAIVHVIHLSEQSAPLLTKIVLGEARAIRGWRMQRRN